MIYQMHDKHGRTMPTTTAEALENEKQGWRTVTEAEFYDFSEKKAKKEPNKAEEPDLIERYAEKFGKPPHHRMTEETIKAKLDADNS